MTGNKRVLQHKQSMKVNTLMTPKYSYMHLVYMRGKVPSVKHTSPNPWSYCDYCIAVAPIGEAQCLQVGIGQMSSVMDRHHRPTSLYAIISCL